MPSPLRHALLPAPPQALFLDRDGTIIEDRHYLRDPGGVVLLPGAGEALGRLARAGVRLFLVTNQSGIGRGYFSEADFRACQSRLEELLRPWGASFAAVYMCPHGPEDHCACRKPRTGMWERARGAWNLDPARCVMVGDKPDDLLFGINAGMAAAFLARTGHGSRAAENLGLPAPAQSSAEALTDETPPGEERTEADQRAENPASAGMVPIDPQRLVDAGCALPSRPVTRLACVPDLAALAPLLTG
ncbi:MAG: HAD family hydrolase [Desulfovibrionaceae bacterium]|nr:HAD family hydrolase [Desulfovibrionaceae bacterium]